MKAALENMKAAFEESYKFPQFFDEFLDVPESEVTAMLAMIFCGLLKL